jgi:23S rRNA pseudouridine2605 synthase/16S rRNA pseudouridine516 synthase
MAELRLHVHLARCGVASRRACERLIRAGLVRVNGEVVDRLGMKVDPATDRVEVDGRTLRRPEAHRYVLLHKPRGVVATARDPEGRPTVLDLVPDVAERMYPVGRLDVQTEGLLLLTNDGDLAQRLLHPRHEVPRVYMAKVRQVPGEAALARLARGVVLEGRRTAPMEVRVTRRLPAAAWLEVTVREGRQHLVRDALEHVGHPVSKLKRVAFGPLSLGRLRPGQHRRLRPEEVSQLRRAAGAPGPVPSPRGRSGPGDTRTGARRTAQTPRKRSP